MEDEELLKKYLTQITAAANTMVRTHGRRMFWLGVLVGFCLGFLLKELVLVIFARVLG